MTEGTIFPTDRIAPDDGWIERVPPVVLAAIVEAGIEPAHVEGITWHDRPGSKIDVEVKVMARAENVEVTIGRADLA